MFIPISCLPKPGKYPEKPRIALPGRPNHSLTQWIGISAFEIVFKPRGYPTRIDEGTTIVNTCGMNFCNSKSCPLDTPRNPI